MLKTWQKPNPRREKKILEYRKKGYSLNQIAGIFHLSKQRIWQIVKTTDSKALDRPAGFDKIKTRVGNSKKAEKK